MAYYISPFLSNTISLFSPPIKTTNPNKPFLINPYTLKLTPKTNQFPNHICFNKQTQNPTSTPQNNPQLLLGISTNMWWANVKKSIGQRFNLEGILFASKILTKHPNLLLPHLKVPNISYINWVELHNKGFKGVVFDKDNTITLPYKLSLWDPLKHSVESCKAVFGDQNVAIFSNSVGLYEFDSDESKAEALEREIGVRVIRHKVKKPAGNSEEIEKQLGCESMEIVMVGDRRFTDVVFGNRNGFLTVLTEPLTCKGENFVVKLVRKFEEFFVEWKCKRGLKVMDHCLLSKCDVNLVVLDEPLL